MVQDLFYHCNHFLRNNADGYLNRNKTQFTIFKVLLGSGDETTPWLYSQSCHLKDKLPQSHSEHIHGHQVSSIYWTAIMVHWWNLFVQLHMIDTPMARITLLTLLYTRVFKQPLLSTLLKYFSSSRLTVTNWWRGKSALQANPYWPLYDDYFTS